MIPLYDPTAERIPQWVLDAVAADRRAHEDHARRDWLALDDDENGRLADLTTNERSEYDG